MGEGDRRFVGRGGEKLDFALGHFGLDVKGATLADLGCNVGGFTDCLLKRGAARVYAVDTGYGALDYSLRRDPRVVAMERTNALHVKMPEPLDGVVIDVGWTRQELILPAAMRMLKPGAWALSLVKPHYEAEKRRLRGGVLPPDEAEGVLGDVIRRLEATGIVAEGRVESPLAGDAGNREFFILVYNKKGAGGS